MLKYVQMNAVNARTGPRIQAKWCPKHTGIFHKDTGQRANIPHHPFVDDNHMIEVRRFIYQAMAALIESLYRIFGFPLEIFRRIPLNMDKYYHAKCSTRKEQLGLIVDTHKMIVELPNTKCAKILSLLSHRYSGRKSFKKTWNSLELQFLCTIFANSKLKLFTPTLYLVGSSPDFFAHGDACLSGTGGFCLELNFWWYFE